MLTTLPDLPYSNYGNAVLEPGGFHSDAKASRRTYPRSDVETVIPWTTFPEDVHQAIVSATESVSLDPTPFSIAAWERTEFVQNENTICAHAIYALHSPVEEVVNRLGVDGRFVSPDGNSAIIGDPDFSWIAGPAQAHPKLVVEYKTWWAADLVDLPAVHARRPRDIPGKQSLGALHQIYGYMTFNENKYGILTNWQRVWFLRRSETLGRRTLECYLVKLDGTSTISMLKAWVGMVLLANDDWFYASPTPASVPPTRNFTSSKKARKARKRAFNHAGGDHAKPDRGQYPCLDIDFHLCRFELSSSRRGANGCVVSARFLGPTFWRSDIRVICKVVDVQRYPAAGDQLAVEARAYAALHDLQGRVIPRFHGFYRVWGILRFIALEPVGDAIPEDENINQTLRRKMRAALQHIHDAGYIHGDVARRNFCRTQSGNIFLVDLETCRPVTDRTGFGDEMSQVDEL